jgi:sialate O-acetylesterase
MNKYFNRIIFISFLAFIHLQTTFANISLPEIFSDNMVLQQKSEVTFWGWASTGEKVVINASWLQKELSVIASSQGKWSLVVETPQAGGPYEIVIKGYNEIKFKNVLIGEVWLCSGQSNMAWSARSGINNAEEEIENASYPNIRLFTVYQATSLYPQDHFTGEWVECTPETMQNFSAVAYFFARNLSKELGVPVGVINSSWGGTPAESWMPEEMIQKNDFLRDAAALQKPVPWGPVEPARIYNSMISPMIPFRIAGALWYQGEANTVNAYAYKELLSGLISSWRTKWGYDFPFYFAQIAPYKYGKTDEGVEVRDAQRRALETPNTGMIILSDIGDTANIHPKNKQDVGLRFANLALNRFYKTKNIEDSGPLFKSMTTNKNKSIIDFDHSDGLHSSEKKITCFEIAGDDGIFYPATAKIKDQKVILQSDKVKQPAKVRFAWSNTATPDLFNGAGLPASCFRTGE